MLDFALLAPAARPLPSARFGLPAWCWYGLMMTSSILIVHALTCNLCAPGTSLPVPLSLLRLSSTSASICTVGYDYIHNPLVFIWYAYNFMVALIKVCESVWQWNTLVHTRMQMGTSLKSCLDSCKLITYSLHVYSRLNNAGFLFT